MLSSRMRPVREVSVVIPTLNQLAHLQAAIASVLRQAAVDVEVIVAEDGGTDETAAWLARLDDPRVRALEPAGHGGAAWQCNRALEAARAELVMFLDHDDELLQGALKKLAEALRGEPRVVAAVGARTRRGRRMTHPSHELVREVETELLGGWSAISGQLLSRPDTVREVGGWTVAYDEVSDRDLLLKLATRGPFVLIPDVVMDYRIHPGQWPRPADIEERRVRLFGDPIAGLPPGRARRARRTCRPGRRWSAGLRALERGDGTAAVANFLGTAAISPG